MIRSEALMGTVVTVRADAPPEAVARAFDWFRAVEASCSRFDERSELRSLQPGRWSEVSPLLFEALRFALQVADETNGAFDPTLGHRLAARGFDRHYATRERADAPGDDGASWRDVELDGDSRGIRLTRALTLDLGAVAKGLAIDTAARELAPWHDFVIDAGGDLYFGGRRPEGEAWRAGIRHPRDAEALIARVTVCDQAVCTSGDYERPGHLLDARDDARPAALCSATVIASSAMLADALSTAAFVLGPTDGLALLTRLGVEGLLVTTSLDCHRTPGFPDA